MRSSGLSDLILGAFAGWSTIKRNKVRNCVGSRFQSKCRLSTRLHPFQGSCLSRIIFVLILTTEVGSKAYLIVNFSRSLAR